MILQHKKINKKPHWISSVIYTAKLPLSPQSRYFQTLRTGFPISMRRLIGELQLHLLTLPVLSWLLIENKLDTFLGLTLD